MVEVEREVLQEMATWLRKRDVETGKPTHLFVELASGDVVHIKLLSDEEKEAVLRA
jgi:hypothetical protein